MCFSILLKSVESHLNLTLQRTTKNSLSPAGFELEREFELDRSRQRIFRCPLQGQINMNLVFHISEDGSEIELKHCASSKTSVKPLQKYFAHLNWIRLATNPSWLDSSIGRAAV